MTSENMKLMVYAAMRMMADKGYAFYNPKPIVAMVGMDVEDMDAANKPYQGGMQLIGVTVANMNEPGLASTTYDDRVSQRKGKSKPSL